MKIYFASDKPETRNKVGVFLGGITNLGNSWRYYLLEKLKEKFGNEDIDVFVPEPVDTSILTWGDFYKTMVPGYNQVKWEMDYGDGCQIWTMFMPTYANKYDSGPEFSSPSSDPSTMHPIAVKALDFALKENVITQSEYNDQLLKLTISNIGCQVRFEAGYLAGTDKHEVVWGKVWNSLQISFGPYISKSTMHVLQKDELQNGHLVPDTFVEELCNRINDKINSTK